MKRSLLLIAASLGLLSTTQADIVEGNVVIQLKVTRQAEPMTSGNFITKKQKVGTYKNADFIKQMGDLRGGAPFSKSAKLIFRTFGSTTRYYIRDGGTDYEISNNIFVGPRVDVSPLAPAVATGKTSTTTPKTGSEKVTYLGNLLITSSSGDIPELTLQGSYLESTQYAKGKENPDITIPVVQRTVVGYGHFAFPISGGGTDRGLIQGTSKHTGAKNIPYPDDD